MSSTTKKLSALEKLSARAKPVAVDEGKAVAIPLDKIRFDPTQPRQAFHHPDGRIAEDDEASLDELAQSIESQGLIHPITVEPIGDGTYRVVVGERRTRAYLKLGRTTIEAKIRDDLTNPKKRLIYQVAENVNRKDLTDADMAMSIRSLMEWTVAV
jgi:ParB/RepB/Spo0J family partition protein